MCIRLCLREARTSRKRPPLARRRARRTDAERSARRRAAGWPGARGRRAAGAGRSPGAERASVPRGLGRGGIADRAPQQHTVAPPRAEPTEQNRSSLHRRPTPPSASRPYSRFLARPIPASLRVASMVDPPLSNQTPTHASRPPCPVAAAPPPAHQHPPGQTRPTFTWHVEEGGSGAKRRTPLPRKAQAGSEGNTRGRGGGLLRSGPKPIERNRWSETQGGKHGLRQARGRFWIRTTVSGQRSRLAGNGQRNMSSSP